MSIEIQPASLSQVVASDRNDFVEISQDVLDVAKQLRDIDPGLKVFFDEVQEHYVVEHHTERPDGSVDEHLVLTSLELDPRVVKRVREISSSGYDYVAELDRMDAEAERREEQRFSEQRGPILEQLAHALRKDLGLKKNF